MIEILFYGLIILVVVCLLDTMDPNGRLFQVEVEDDEDEQCSGCIIAYNPLKYEACEFLAGHEGLCSFDRHGS